MDAINTATNGLIAASQRFEASAASTATSSGDPASNTVDQITAKQDFAASASVVRTADQMMKTLLDIKV